jgi:hypothetical protein
VLWLHADNAFTLLWQRGAIHSAGTHSADITAAHWYYLREGFFRLTVPATLLIGFGLWYIVRRRTTAAWAAAWLVVSGILFIAILSVPSDKSDRYALFAFISLIPACVLGIRFMAVKLTHLWPIVKPAYLAIILLPIIYLAADDIRLHPYYLAHYNRLYPIEATHKLGWGEGLETAAAWIAQQNPQAKVLSYYPRVFQYFYHGPVDTITHIDSANWDYIVLYRAMFERAPDDPETDIVNNYLTSKKYQPAHIVTVNGLPYAWIFAAAPQAGQ